MVDPGGDITVVDPRGDFRTVHEVGTGGELVEPGRGFAISSSRLIMIDRLREQLAADNKSTIGDQCTIPCTNRTSLFSEVWTDIKGQNLDTVQMRIPNG